MRISGMDMRTCLTVEQAASVFQETAASMFTGAAKLSAGLRRLTNQLPGAQRVEFFTPRSESPFAALESDEADFCVGVSIPKAAGSGGGVVVVQFFAWDRGDHREIRLRSPSTIGSSGSTRQVLVGLRQAYAAKDTQLKIQEV
ncbi:hypothetical protein [Streptomyces sp. SLBN-118]|uniref:hypothetical protein n=1 Tax=Streptomyces sp. SLBN-118 TaxID=2768454 RepID=UPI001151CFDA|nr:hypothetical protein [Streptomyces sp. SLBN-118]